MNNYKSCPLKKRPVFYEEPAEADSQINEQPQDLSIKRKAEDECQSDAKRNFALNLTVNSIYDNMKSGSELKFNRPESPISISSEASHGNNSLSPPAMEYSNIHLRGLSPTNMGYTNGFIPFNPLAATVWNNYNFSHLTQQSFIPAPVYSYQMTPPSSPGSCSSSSEPEDLSLRGDIPLLDIFIESPSSVAESAVHVKSYRYKCEKCSKMYSTSIGLSKHQQYHCPAANCNQEKKSHSCHECGKLYTTLGALKMHIRTHTLPCKCPICAKAFSRPWLLQGHIRTHTGEKPFTCTDCNRSFADRSNLRAHQQTHVEVKKYVCKVCNKSFSRMSLLNKHANSNCTITIY